MVLDAKALTWASRHDIDTAKLKAARVPIYGKWYFPEIPAGVPLISLQTGEQRTFPERMIAGEVIWVAEADLRRAGLMPSDVPVVAPPRPAAAPAAAAVVPPEPLLMMVRPVRYASPTVRSLVAPPAPTPPRRASAADLAGIHMPLASVAPFVLAVGLCIAGLGLVTHPIILVVGLLWMLAGAVAWVRIGLIESEAAAHHAHAEHSAEGAEGAEEAVGVEGIEGANGAA